MRPNENFANELAGSRQQGGPDFNPTALFPLAKVELGHGGLEFHRCLAVLSLELSLNVFHGKLWQLADHDIDLGREAKAKIDHESFRS